MLLFHWSLVLEGRNFGENSTLLVFLWLTWACIVVVEAWYFTIVQSKGNMFKSQKFRKKHLRDGTLLFLLFFQGWWGYLVGEVSFGDSSYLTFLCWIIIFFPSIFFFMWLITFIFWLFRFMELCSLEFTVCWLD